MKLLDLEGVAAGYRAGEWVVEAIDLVLEDRDFIALIGPNGCGKSTLLRTMTGVIPEWKGRISVGGNEPTTRLRYSTWSTNSIAQRILFWLMGSLVSRRW